MFFFVSFRLLSITVAALKAAAVAAAAAASSLLLEKQTNRSVAWQLIDGEKSFDLSTFNFYNP